MENEGLKWDYIVNEEHGVIPVGVLVMPRLEIRDAISNQGMGV